MPSLLGGVVGPGGSIGLVTLLALALVSCGGTSATHHSPPRRPVPYSPPPRPSATHGPPARTLPASPVAMTQTPRAELAFCRRNVLLRSVCPRRIPAWGSARGTRGYACIDRHGNEPPGGTALVTLFTSGRCVNAEWAYENGEPLPGDTAGARLRLSGWDGSMWIPIPGEALMTSPPLHVHVDIDASVGSPADIGLGGAWPEGAQRVTDALLNPKRNRAVSLGWVRWYGRYGQLVLAPVFPVGGEWGGHLIFYVPPDVRGVSYAITLHAWMPALRLTGSGVDRVVRFQSGPALPHVIATLKAIVGSTLVGA